jgi:hypothetical protein
MKNPKFIFMSALAVFTGWMFSSNLQRLIDSYFPNVSPLFWVVLSMGLAYFGYIKLA